MPHAIAGDGTRLSYEDVGTGPVVLLLHSWALESTIWERQVPAFLSAGHRVVSLDRRGHGRSDYAAGGYDLDILVDDAIAVLEWCGVRRCTVVAHSIGGLEAVRLCTRWGGVTALALVAPFGPDLSHQLGPGMLESMLDELAADRPRYFRDRADAYFARPASNVSDALVENILSTIQRTPPDVAAELLRMGWHADLTAELASLTVPVLVVQGDADASAPIDLTGRRFAALIPTARLEVYRGAPHGLYVTEADRLNADLVGFLDASRDSTDEHAVRARTRRVVDDLVTRIAAGAPEWVAALYAPEIDWALNWPDGPAAHNVPWIRSRPDREALQAHYEALAAHNRPAPEPTTVERVLVDGEDAVVLGTIRNVVTTTGSAYVARFALHLTVRGGLVVRHHVYEDSLAVALAAGAVTPT